MNEEIKFFVDVLKGVAVTSFAAAVFRDVGLASSAIYATIGMVAFLAGWWLVRRHE